MKAKTEEGVVSRNEEDVVKRKVWFAPGYM